MSIASRVLRQFSYTVALLLALATMVPLGTTAADARAGGGFSFGSRGARTYSAPGLTRTAPSGAQPIQRSETPQSGSGGTAAGVSQPRRFGFGSGLAAGLLGAGLFGLFGGHGFGLIPLLLIGALIWFAVRALRGGIGGLAGGTTFRGGAPSRRDAAYAGPYATARYAPGGPAAAGSGPNPRASQEPITVSPDDFDAFESALVDVETAYGREDMNALSRLVTPEMLRNFDADLRQNRSRGLHNDIGDVRLLQGDLAEAWREGRSDYATVAMRFSLRDLMVERNGNRVVSGDPSRPSEATELWTFRRDDRGPWRLSAIQQTG